MLIPLDILLAEDNAINQLLAISLLEDMGYQADVAENGQEVLEALTRKHYDVILMDMQMPIMDGITATQEVIQKWGKNRPTIIAMTANVMAEDKKRCFDAGMDDFVSKPIAVEKLVDALLNCKKEQS